MDSGLSATWARMPYSTKFVHWWHQRLGPLVVGYGYIDGTETAFFYNDLTGTWEILPNLLNNFESSGSSVNNHGVDLRYSHNNQWSLHRNHLGAS